jgi:hypothetical protein
VAQSFQQMSWYRGDCASCGFGAKHSNFRGRRSGYGIPDPCFVELRKDRPKSDDRICQKCYNDHEAGRRSEAVPLATPQPQQIRSRSGSLDGSHWTTDSSERAAKMMRRLNSGERVIPFDLHVEKLEEMKVASRVAAEAQLCELQTTESDFRDSFVVQRYLKCKRVPEDDKAMLVKRLVEWYKAKPSRERALLFRDLSNRAAQELAEISSRTMAKARDVNFKRPERKAGSRKTKSGFGVDEVERIIAAACLNSRFCEVRSWITHAGDRSERHFEAVALVDGRTMWKELCKQHGDFCCLRTFYNHLPGFYVPSKKERCVCKRCKKGRSYLDSISMLVSVLRETFGGEEKDIEVIEILKDVRLKLVELYGHLDKEFVLEIADGRHANNCQKCGLLEVIPGMLNDVMARIGRRKVQISPKVWASVFPGKELPPDGNSRMEKLFEFLQLWDDRTKPFVDHLRLKADRICALEADVAALERERDTEVWYTDYMMTVKLRGTQQETEEDFLAKDVANNLGFMRVYWDKGEIWREYWDFVFEGSKDIQTTLQIQLRLHQIVEAHRLSQGLPRLRILKIWGDNAGDFKGGDIWDQWQKQLKGENVAEHGGLERVEMKYHAAGEGKTELDAHFGHLTTERRRRERAKMERRNVADLLDSMRGIEATHVVHVELGMEEQSRFYATAKNINALHEVHLTRNGIQGRPDTQAEFEQVNLGIVRERKSKRAREKKASVLAGVEQVTNVQLCQTCYNPAKKDEDLSAWIRCENCERSWHKTCIGIKADVPLEDIEWKTCRDCGGKDPKGEMLEKRRKAPICNVCGFLVRGNKHDGCKQQRIQQVEAQRTQAAHVISRFDPFVARKPKSLSDEKRKSKKMRRRRAKKERIVKINLEEAFGEHL